jgi:lytic cellulose monooxygenase (C1-hydroxylating)
MHFITFISILLLTGSTTAHIRLYGVWVNGVDQGDGRTKYIRSPPNDNPVKDLRSPTIACNKGGEKPASSFVKAVAGDKLTFEWYHEARSDMIIDPSHKGPVITYIAPYTDTDGSGARWSKIAEDGYTNGVWAVEKLIQNKGKVDITLPSVLASGKYLVRQEIIAHHESFERYDEDPLNGAQFYPVCVQFNVTGSGTAVPNRNYDFNPDKGGYKYSDEGIHFDLYGSFSSYVIPGPKIWPSANGGSSNGTIPADTPASTIGLKTESDILDAPAMAPVPTEPKGGQPTDDPPPPVRTAVTGSCAGHRRKSKKCRH